MIRLIGICTVLSLCVCAQGEMRTWTSSSGKTVEGEYVSSSFDNVNIENANGEIIKIPIELLCEEDLTYIELANPPELSIDFLESAQQVFIKPSPLWSDNSPITILDHTFGVRIKKTDSKEYNHELVIEGYEFSQQVWDLSKYRLIQKFKSEPFILTKKNRKYEYHSPDTSRLAKIIIDQGTGASLPRGQKMAESLVVVRDERGEVIAYRTTRKAFYKNLARLERLPRGAWLNEDCVRVHPSSPPPYKLGYLPNTY